MYDQGQVWSLTIGSITVTLSIEPDHDYVYDGDDPDGETQAALDSGEYVAFDSTVRVFRNGYEIGSDYLGGSVYAWDDVSDFWTAHRDPDPLNRNCSTMRAARGRVSIGHYFPDMVSEAVAEARRTLGCAKAA